MPGQDRQPARGVSVTNRAAMVQRGGVLVAAPLAWHRMQRPFAPRRSVLRAEDSRLAQDPRFLPKSTTDYRLKPRPLPIARLALKRISGILTAVYYDSRGVRRRAPSPERTP